MSEERNPPPWGWLSPLLDLAAMSPIFLFALSVGPEATLADIAKGLVGDFCIWINEVVQRRSALGWAQDDVAAGAESDTVSSM